MEYQIEESTQAGRLILNGEMGIQQAAALKEQLLNVQEIVRHLVVDVQGVTVLDVSALQIFCSAHRTFTKLRKEITFAGSLPPVWVDFMEVAGFARVKGCSVDSNNTCLWMRKGNL
jgi:anti-anti-sigma factor